MRFDNEGVIWYNKYGGKNATSKNKEAVMKTRIITKKFTLTDDVREWVDKKLKKLDKFFPDGTEANVVLASTRLGEKIEITISAGGALLRAEVDDKDYKCALDSAMAHLERQIRKNRTRLEKKLKVPKVNFSPEELLEAEDQQTVVKTKSFDMRPMTVDDAILQMNLLGHSFYMFLNTESSDYNVVYKRADGDYGVIEPAK